MAATGQRLLPPPVAPAALGRLAPARPNGAAVRRTGARRYPAIPPLCPAGEGTRRHRPPRLPETPAETARGFARHRPARGGGRRAAAVRCAGGPDESARAVQDDSG